MPKIRIDGIQFDSPAGWTILDVARFLGIEIPTLCYEEGLSVWGGCRLCIVEIDVGDKTKVVSSCTYPVEEGLVVRTATKRIVEERKEILELLISQCPTAKKLQDLAAKMGLGRVRFTPKWEDCIYCGLCVRICDEQMGAKAIGFVNKGNTLKITTPFDKTSELCRKCGACMYICPACTLRCEPPKVKYLTGEGPAPENVLCGRCENAVQPTCLEFYNNYACWMGLKGECGTCVREKSVK